MEGMDGNGREGRASAGEGGGRARGRCCRKAGGGVEGCRRPYTTWPGLEPQGPVGADIIVCTERHRIDRRRIFIQRGTPFLKGLATRGGGGTKFKIWFVVRLTHPDPPQMCGGSGGADPTYFRPNPL